MINKSIIYIFLIIIFSCSTKKSKCLCEDSKVVQKLPSSEYTVFLVQRDFGAYGKNIDLNICSKNDNKLLESIGIRSEDRIPKIDSIVGNEIYLHYSYPWKEKGKLEFDEVVLGDALINRDKLKYNYIFYNK